MPDTRDSVAADWTRKAQKFFGLHARPALEATTPEQLVERRAELVARLGRKGAERHEEDFLK